RRGGPARPRRLRGPEHGRRRGRAGRGPVRGAAARAARRDRPRVAPRLLLDPRLLGSPRRALVLGRRPLARRAALADRLRRRPLGAPRRRPRLGRRLLALSRALILVIDNYDS